MRKKGAVGSGSRPFESVGQERISGGQMNVS
jgi:hypothetical protein